LFLSRIHPKKGVVELLRSVAKHRQLFENFGIVVPEALAAGVPVMTTHGAPWHELETKHCGWWIPVGQAALDAELPKLLSVKPEDLAAMASGAGSW
jgi:glycosyltransferase involved in cell wall biosynthesis